MHAEHSLFTSLHKWARQQDENFCTEGLIYVLRLLLQESPLHAETILSWLTDGLIGPECRTERVTVTGQVSGDEGRPDIEISTASKTAWVEAKVDSAVGPTQLERYRRMLARKPGEKKLILLSRGADELAEANRPDRTRTWIGLSDQLDRVLFQLESFHANVAFILRDYLSFLGPKQMKLNAVSRSASHSITDVGTIFSQIKLACAAARLQWKWNNSDAKSYLGYLLSDGAECVGWVGFNLTDPQWLFYTTDGAHRRGEIDTTVAQSYVSPGMEWDGKNWMHSIDLQTDEAYLAVIADEQVEYLRRRLIEESVEAYRSMLKAVSG